MKLKRLKNNRATCSHFYSLPWMSSHETPSQSASLVDVDASQDYEVLVPHKQFSDWNASWIKFKFPSRQFMKLMSIPIPAFFPAYISPRFQAPDLPEVHFPSFLLKFLHLSRYNWPHFAGRMKTSSVWTLFVLLWLYSPEWSLCWALNFPFQECSYTESIPAFIFLLREKNEAILPTKSGV